MGLILSDFNYEMHLERKTMQFALFFLLLQINGLLSKTKNKL
jgi:hypothetical protein